MADSYIADERVGFAEPVPGVELYLCPPLNKTLEMLAKVTQKEHLEALNAIDNGLIGVIVWRKLSTTSPNSSSHHKHISKKQHFSSRRHHHDSNSNAKFASKPAPSRGVPTTSPRPSPDDDDDIPPGFGPTASRDEDDLPEFNFSGGSVPSVSAQKPSRGLGMAPFRPPSQAPSRPVEQVRELIQRYGQSNATSTTYPGNWNDKGSSGVAVQAWNDDDDDIPEWQPQLPHQHQQTPLQQVHSYQQQPMLRPHFVNQPPLGSSSSQQQQPVPQQTMMPLQQSMQPQQGTWWVPPVPVQGNSLRPEIAQFYSTSGQGISSGGGGGQPGMARQQNVPKSRGF